MNLSPLHQSPEQKLAASSQGTLAIAKEQLAKLDEATKALTKLQTTASESKTAAILQEVKSAALITNRLLKDMKSKEVQKMEIINQPDDISKAFFSMLKGPKGDKGLSGAVGPQGAPGTAGKDGTDGKDGAPGRDGKPGLSGTDGRNGLDGIAGRDGIDGRDGSPDTPDQVVEKINESKKWINPARVKGLAGILETVDQIGKNPQGVIQNVGGGMPTLFLSNGARISDYVTEINFSTNITPVYNGNGRITLTASGGSSTTYQQTPVGLINGSNVTYTTTNTITTVLNFAINGQYLHPTSDYTFSGTTITMVTALDASLSGKPFTITYQ